MKKVAISLLTLPLLVGCASRSFEDNNQNDPIIKCNMNNNDPMFTNDEDELNWLEKSILDGGASFLKSGLTSLAVYGLKTACSEMGIDVRDATTKKLDLIIDKLNKIEQQITDGFNAVNKKAQQIQDENIMTKVLERLQEVRNPVLAQMDTLENLAIKEQNGYDKEKLAKERDEFIGNFAKYLNFYGLSNNLTNATTLLANELHYPNKIKTSQTLMDLYDNTFGANDIWDYQSVEPRCNFIKECAFLINSMALLAKLECSKEISKYAEGDSNINTIEKMFKGMCDEVNGLNAVFQKELKKLYEIKNKHNDDKKPTMSHLKRNFDSNGNLHVTVDYTISAYLATVNLNDVTYNNLVDDDIDEHTTYHCFKTYKSNSDFNNLMLNDYKNYINTFKVSDDYNFKYYLRDMGFRVPSYQQENFDKSIGIYNEIPDARVSDRGIFRGVDYYCYYNYYDWNTQNKSRDYCRVGETFWKNYDDVSNYTENINQYYVAFINANHEELLGYARYSTLHTDGSYKSDLTSHVYRSNKVNDTWKAIYSLNV